MNTNKYAKHAPKFETDAFSDLLRLLQLNVDIYHNAKVCGDWQINEHVLGTTCFHLVTLGECRLEVPGYMSTNISQGDLVIFPRELPHSMTPLNKSSGPQEHRPYHTARSLEGTGMLCGEVHFQHKTSQFLLENLPAIFILPYQEETPWMGFLFEMILTESLSPNAASKAILDKLSEMLFTYALRQHLATNEAQTGFLKLYVHEKLNKAITAIHKTPDKNWTLEAMAAEAGMSRTVFAETFKSISGWTAGQYLTWWRMQLAWTALSQGDGVAETAENVGYNSEAAFSRAFQKTFATTVGKVRKNKI